MILATINSAFKRRIISLGLLLLCGWFAWKYFGLRHDILRSALVLAEIQISQDQISSFRHNPAELKKVQEWRRRFLEQYYNDASNAVSRTPVGLYVHKEYLKTMKILNDDEAEGNQGLSIYK